MAPIKVVVHGATGKMGAQTVTSLAAENDLTLVGGTCRQDRDGSLTLTGGESVPSPPTWPLSSTRPTPMSWSTSPTPPPAWTPPTSRPAAP